MFWLTKLSNILVKIIRFQPFGAVIFLFLLLSAGCKKDALLKTGAQPKEDELHLITTDTFTVVAYSYKLDSVKSDNKSQATLGYMIDSKFGKSIASFVAQVKPSGAAVVFDNFSEVIVDSVVFSFHPKVIYGPYKGTNNLVAGFSCSLYSLTDDILFSNNYYSNEQFNYDQTPIATSSYDSLLFIDSLSYFESIKFKLDNTVGKGLLTMVNSNADNSTFWSTYKGFVIQPNYNSFDDNLMFLLDLHHNKTKLSVYYRQNSLSTISEEYQFVIDNECEKINLFDTDYTGADIKSSFNNAVAGKELLYVKDMNEVRVGVDIPYLKNLINNNNIVINKAELVFPVKTDALTDYGVNYELALYAYNQDSLLLPTIDQTAGYPQNHFSGVLNNSNQFVFNITRNTQYLFNALKAGNNVNFGYSLLPLSPADNVNGTIIYGTDPLSATEKTKFVLTYSIVE